MSSNKPSLPSKRSTGTDISHFLDKANTLPQRKSNSTSTHGRLVFALDATASRQPSWDRACQLQSQMFTATNSLGELQVQLCYYRGFNEFYFSPWLNSTQSLLKTMTGVHCLGGYTQIERVLNHCLKQQQRFPVKAVIIIADAVEESVDTLCAKAGKLGLLGVPLFMFQEGMDNKAQHCFQQMALLSKGAYATFDETSANQLAQLLSAVATFASGGYKALQRLQSTTAQQLLQQLKH